MTGRESPRPIFPSDPSERFVYRPPCALGEPPSWPPRPSRQADCARCVHGTPAWSSACDVRLQRYWWARGAFADYCPPAGLPAKLAKVEPDTPPKAEQVTAWARGDRWLTEGPQHLVLKGPAGAGKSWLAVRLALRLLPDRRAVYLSVPLFDPVAHADLIAKWSQAGVLVLDDLGQEWDRPGGSYAANRLDALVRSADAAECRVIVTTNLTKTAMTGRYSPAMMDRLTGDGWEVKLDSGSFRGRVRNAVP